MPLAPLTVALTTGQQIETLKRFRARYGDELKKLELELTEVLTALAEADFLAPYLGEQPEVVELRARKADADKLERRRQYLAMIIDRLDQVIPQQPAVAVQVPNAAGGKPAGVRRY